MHGPRHATVEPKASEDDVHFLLQISAKSVWEGGKSDIIQRNL